MISKAITTAVALFLFALTPSLVSADSGNAIVGNAVK